MAEALDDIAELFDEAVSHYSSSYSLHIAAANFHGFITMNKHLEGIHLSLAAALKPPFDVAVWLHLRQKLAKMDTTKGNAAKANIYVRVEFDKQSKSAEELALQARTDIVSGNWHCCFVAVTLSNTVVACVQLEFWEELAKRVPSQKRLVQLGKQFSDSMMKADTEYRGLLAMNPNSVKALRAYARFLLEVANDKSKVTATCCVVQLTTHVPH